MRWTIISGTATLALTSLGLLTVGPRAIRAQSISCTGRLITSSSVGPLHVGMPLDSVRAICGSVRDTMEMAEGDPYREVYVLVDGDTLKLDISNDHVGTIHVSSPHFTTADSLRVGMPLSQFLKGRSPQVGVGEGQVFLLDKAHHCGNSFGLSDEAYIAVPKLTAAGLHRLPASTKVTDILVLGITRWSGCRAGS